MTYDPVEQMKLEEKRRLVELAELQESARDWLDERVRDRFGKSGQVLPLEFFPSAMLGVVCRPIARDVIKSRLMRSVSENMVFTMYMCGGIGLAAPQVGFDQRIFVLDWSADRKHPVTCINPEMLSLGEELAPENEACLSMPGVKVRVDRPTTIRVAFYDLTSTRVELDLTGWAARAFLHELDHLEGKMMFDHPSVHRISKAQAIKAAGKILKGEKAKPKKKRRY